MIKQILFFTLTLMAIQMYSQEEKSIEFYQTDWGRTTSWDTFCERVKSAGYDGIEIWFPKNSEDQEQLKAALKKYSLKVGFLNGTNKSLPFKESLANYASHLKMLTTWQPAYINCHTGSDFFSFEQNKDFIKLANSIARESGIPIYHETHRGRFSFNLPDTKTYLKAIPDLKLNLDISHWMVVHESLLENKDELLNEVITNTHHLHARVGQPQAPQVNDPEAPEWKKAVDRHMNIWEKVIRTHWETNNIFTLTTEVGPAGYMPTLPYTRVPVADQWKANRYMMKLIKERMNIE